MIGYLSNNVGSVLLLLNLNGDRLVALCQVGTTPIQVVDIKTTSGAVDERAALSVNIEFAPADDASLA